MKLLQRGNKLTAIVLILVVALIGILAGILILGSYRWSSETQSLRARLDEARMPVGPPVVDFRELEGLPPPVQRFFKAVLTEGQPMVAEARIRHSGTFNMGEDADQWKPFGSDQKIIARRPGFDWNGTIDVMPGVSVRVHDAYVAGEGILHASLAGLLSLANLRGTTEMAHGELMRFFAEATWYPTVLLPSQGVDWRPVDERSAQATLTDGDVSVTMLFTFDESGPVQTVYAEARGRMLSGMMVPTPWQGRFWNYEKRNQMLVPLEGEVSWILPSGPRPYWRGRIIEILHEFEH